MGIKRYYHKLAGLLGLSFSLAVAEFKLRNEGSYLGIFWYLLNPVLMFFLIFLVFAGRLGNDIPQYSLYLLLGLIMLNFFQNSTTQAIKAITENRAMIKSISFPREALVLGTIICSIFSHLFEVALFFIVGLLLGVSLLGIFWYFLVFVFFVFFILGLSFILSSLQVYFVDLENIWIFVSRLIMFGTPIFYSIGGQTRLLYVNLFNPLYFFITLSRDLIIYRVFPQGWLVLGVAGYSLLFLVIGLWIFNRLKVKFDEMM
ncbi:MAG: ABC transporter permease [archaeon]